MSIRAEVMRLFLRVVVRPNVQGEASLGGMRRHIAFLTRVVPRPPKGTEAVTVDAGGAPASLVRTSASRPHRHVLYLHGGGYIFGSPPLYRDMTWRIANATRACVLCLEYRLAPEHPFPAALDDTVAAYRWMIQNGADPRHVAMMGDSAGGGLLLAALMRLRDEGAPLPAAAVAVSPWTDLALTGETLHTNAARDPLIPIAHAQRGVALYLGGAEPRHPYVSPLYGDPAGLPPTLIVVGGDEVLRGGQTGG